MARNVPTHADILENFRIELRSGCLALAVLTQLRVEHYAGTLLSVLGNAGLEVPANTLYPLLRRLEDQGLLVSEWKDDHGRRKRFYRVSREGERMLDELADEWHSIATALNRLLHRTAAR